MSRPSLILSFLILISLGLHASNTPSGSVKPAIQNIENIISEALAVRSDYIELEKSKSYTFDNLHFNLENEGGIGENEDNNDEIFRANEEYVRNPNVKKVMEAVEGLGMSQLIETLTESDLVKLPLGIVKTYGNTTYSIVFDRARIYTEYAELRVYGQIKNEKINLCFGAEDLKFSFDGGMIGETSLALFGDFAVPLKSKKIAVVFNKFGQAQNGANDGTYITFDCNGFVEARLDVDISLSRDWVLPTNDLGKVLGGDQRVIGNVATTVRDLDDFVAEISMPHFTMTKDTSVAILVSRAIFDFSEVNNAPSFNHPKRYNFENGAFDAPPPSEEIPLWRGFYIQQIEFVMPHLFKTSTNQPLIIGARELYIDQKGVSGTIYGEGLIPIETGTIGNSGWAFALDYAGIELNCSRILDFDFEGRINIPVNKETQRLNYTAFGIPSEQHYNITIGLDSTMSFPIFKAAEVKLTKGSAVSLQVKENQFVPGAVLCGGMYVKINSNEAEEESDESKVDLDMPGVEFHKLMVRDTLPYLLLAENGGSISLKLPPIVNNSPITIDHLTLTRKGEKRVSLGFGLEVNVQAAEAGGGKTGGTFGILGAYVEENGKGRWVYDGIETQSMEVEIVMGNYLWVKGGLEFFDGDETWGNGFYGYLDGGIMAKENESEEPIGPNSDFKFRMMASARFGTKFPDTDEEYKYWAYDFYLSSSEKLFPIYPPINAIGLGGGVYHHMRMVGYDIKEMAEGGGDNPYSGILYAPNVNTLFGIKLSLGIGIDGVDGFKGNVTLELSVDHNYVLQEIMLYGNAEFASDKFKIDALSEMNSLLKSKEEADEDNKKQAKTQNQNKILAAVMIKMDFVNGFELQGNFGVFLNAADGVILGEAVCDMYVSDERKHLYIGGYEGTTNFKGEALKEASLELSLGNFSVMTKFYFCTGNDLPPPPSVPARIANAFNISSTSSNRASLPQGENDLAKGFAFGANLALNFDLVIVKILKFKFDFLAGFDLSMLSNPSSSYCSSTNKNEHGINGWRAKGQIYGSLESRMDFWVPKLWTPWQGKWTTLFNVDIKVLMMADVPNPSFMDIRYQYRGLWGERERLYEYGEKCGTVILN